MKQYLIGLMMLPIFLAGCAIAPDGKQPPEGKKPEQGAVVSTDKVAVMAEHDIQSIPQHLRPDSLERRSDTDVVIRAGKTKTYKEYRIGGQLYAIHVIPKIGPPYFLVASDNQGNPIDPTKKEMLVPSWTVFEWK
ncbi:MAG: DUF2782 domain-containing protein [Endozoicomonas sp.]